MLPKKRKKGRKAYPKGSTPRTHTQRTWNLMFLYCSVSTLNLGGGEMLGVSVWAWPRGTRIFGAPRQTTENDGACDMTPPPFPAFLSSLTQWWAPSAESRPSRSAVCLGWSSCPRCPGLCGGVVKMGVGMSEHRPLRLTQPCPQVAHRPTYLESGCGTPCSQTCSRASGKAWRRAPPCISAWCGVVVV